METEKNLRAGLDPREARRRAHVRLGGVDAIREAVRDARGGPMKLRMSWLDLKLAGRMLSKYPGLTLVGGFSFAFAIAVAAMAFEFLTQLVYPSLPVPGGDLRAALGADRLRIVISMLKPVFIQVGLGISFAVGIIFLLGVVQSARGAAVVATFAVFTLVISILACAVPIRRALRVEPTEALRAGI